MKAEKIKRGIVTTSALILVLISRIGAFAILPRVNAQQSTVDLSQSLYQEVKLLGDDSIEE